jgi:L-rhamnose mutarotase
MGSYAILVDEHQYLWLAFIQLHPDDKSKISKIKISELSTDWKSYFKRIQFPGGECSKIMSQF